jgi:hypothetical protein
MGLSKFFPLSWLLSKGRGLPSRIKTEPIPWIEASHTTINVFVKSSVAETRVVHVASLSFSKYLVAFLVQ